MSQVTINSEAANHFTEPDTGRTYSLCILKVKFYAKSGWKCIGIWRNKRVDKALYLSTLQLQQSPPSHQQDGANNTAALTTNCRLGLRYICCGGLILNSRPVLDSSAQTRRAMLLDFFVKPQNSFVWLCSCRIGGVFQKTIEKMIFCTKLSLERASTILCIGRTQINWTSLTN